MSKKSQRRARAQAQKAAQAVQSPAKPKKVEFVARPFAGLKNEAELVAMAQIIPAATMTVKLNDSEHIPAAHRGATVELATLLPDLTQGMRRADDCYLIAMQTTKHSGDASRDVAYALLNALELENNTGLQLSTLPEPGPRLQDLLDADFEPVFQLHDSFGFWAAPGELSDEELNNLVNQSRDEIVATRQVPGVEHAFWCRMGGKEYVRWVREEDEDAFFNALAKVHAARESELSNDDGASLGSFLGAFRAYGIAIPVWQLEPGTTAEQLTAPMQALGARLQAALADDATLNADERRAKAGIISRQVNL